MPERFKSPEPPFKMAEPFRSPEPPQAVLSPEPVMNSEREQNGLTGKSMVNGTANGNIKLPGTSTKQMDTTDDQSLTRKKVVKVVRRVVRKVLPTEEEEATVPKQPSDKAPEAAKPAAEPVKPVLAPAPAPLLKAPVMSGFSFKHDVIKTEDKDDFSRGLTNLMVRGRTREPRPRIRKDERPEKLELEKKNEKKEEKVELEETKEEKKEDITTLKPQEANHKHTSSGPVIKEVKTPVMDSEHPAPISSKSTHSRPSSLPPVVGFIPAPKPSALSPPPGFIPAPKPSAVTKPTPTSTTPVAQKSSPLSPPSRFIPALKPSPLSTPVSPDPPRPNSGQLSPPPGVIPIQQPAVSQQEVQCPHFACLVNIWDIGVESAWSFEMHV